MNRQKKLDLIIAHSEEMKWYQDAVAEIEAAQAIDDEVGRRMRDHAGEWRTGSLQGNKAKYNEILKAVREQVISEGK